MAQQFVLKGVKELRDYTSTDGNFTFHIKQDPRGGDTWQIPQWWARKGNNIIYNSCTVFEMENTPYLMIIPTSVDTQLMVTYDGSVDSLVFSNFNAVDRIAITDKSTKKLVVEYMMPSVSGGAIAKRTFQPTGNLGEFTITGKGTIDEGLSSSYQSNATPAQTLSPTYTWSVVDMPSEAATDAANAEVSGGQGTTACTVDWKQAGSYGVKCVISDTNADDDPQEDIRSVTCNSVETVGTVGITGSATPTAEQSEVYTATVTGNSVDTIKYDWSVVDGNATIPTKNQATASITFEAAGNATIQCSISSDDAPDSDAATKVVDVGTAKSIGTITIQADNNTPNATTPDNFQAQIDGNVVDETYFWQVSPADGSFVIEDANAAATNITFNSGGAYRVLCQVSSVTAQPSIVTSEPFDVTVQTIDGFPGVTLGGPQTVSAVNQGKNYTSKVSDDSTLAGNTTYQWTATDENGEVTNNGAVFSTTPGKTATDKDTQITFVTDGKTYQVRCKWTNEAYTSSPKTGMRTVTVDTSADQDS